MKSRLRRVKLARANRRADRAYYQKNVAKGLKAGTLTRRAAKAALRRARARTPVLHAMGSGHSSFSLSQKKDILRTRRAAGDRNYMQRRDAHGRFA